MCLKILEIATLERQQEVYYYRTITDETLFNDKTGHSVFSATMGKNRFKFLLANIRFDDEESRPLRWKSDQFAAVR